LKKASSLTNIVIENFSEEGNDQFYYTGKSQTDVIVRKKEIYDGAVPSGNSTMAANLFYLGSIYDKREWKERAMNLLNTMWEVAVKYPTSFGNWACLLIDQGATINEVAIVGKGFEELRNQLLKNFIPNKVLQCAEIDGNKQFPLLLNKTGKVQPRIYLCRNYTCQLPTDDVKTVIDKVKETTKFNGSYNN
jgi:uncharacterized protein YyaL (SSP411 family)